MKYPEFKQGMTVISAEQMRFLVDRVRAHDLSLARLNGRSVATNVQPTLLAARRFTVANASDYPDTLECYENDGFGGTLHVAKPWLLRRMPFDKKLRDKIAYIYSDNTTRQARKKKAGAGGLPDPAHTDDDTEISEQQIIIPRYVVGDVIYAIRGVARGAEQFAWSPLEPGKTIEVSWIDLNIDGRYWARESGS